MRSDGVCGDRILSVQGLWVSCSSRKTIGVYSCWMIRARSSGGRARRGNGVGSDRSGLSEVWVSAIVRSGLGRGQRGWPEEEEAMVRSGATRGVTRVRLVFGKVEVRR